MASDPTQVAHGNPSTAGSMQRSRVKQAAAPFVSEGGLVIALDAQQTVHYASRGWHRIFGESPRRASGRSLQSALPDGALAPDDEDRLLRALGDALARGPGVAIPLRHGSAERGWRRLEGRAYPARSLRHLPRDLWLLVFHEIEEIGGSAGQGVFRRESSAWSPVPDEDRLRAEKLEILGVLAAGIAHDFNNLLTPIIGNASLLLADLPPGAPERRWAEAIRRAADRAAALTGQMLSLAGNGRGGRPGRTIAKIDLSALIRDFTLLLETTASKTSRIRCELASDLPLVHGEPAQLAQIVVNLVANASSALGEPGGSIRVRTGLTRADRSTLDACYLGESLTPGDYVFVEVCDDAAEISPAARARLLDGSGTSATGDGGRGLGLGLSVVLGTVRAHEGALHVSTARDTRDGPHAGHGGCFRVLLPAAADFSGPTRPPDQASCRSGQAA